MKKMIIKRILVFLCVFLLVIPSGAADASWSGRWVSLKHGVMTFTQNGDGFTAVWTGTIAEGTISGRQASFRFWAGASFDVCKDDSRGYGTLTLSDDGNTLKGTWASLSKADPESGDFIAVRMSSFSDQSAPEAAPAPEEADDAQAAGTDTALPDTSMTADASFQHAGDTAQASAAQAFSITAQPDELILLPDNLPSEYVSTVAEVISDLEEWVLKIFGVFDDDSGDITDTAPHPPEDTALPEDSPSQDAGAFWDFFTDLWTPLWGQFTIDK